MPASDYAEKAVLDWLLGGATPTRPSNRYVSFATQTPTSQSTFDHPSTPARFTATFAVANSPQGSCTNLNTIIVSVGPAAVTAKGVNIWDAAAGGNRLAYGGIANIGAKSADQWSFNPGGLKISLA